MGIQEYPKKYLLSYLKHEDFYNSPKMWESTRGFIPAFPLYLEDDTRELIIPCYNEENKLVSYQMRNIDDENVDTKYRLTKPVYDTIVKTDDRTIEGLKVICEGSIDCALLRYHGVNAWTTLGLKHFKVKRLMEDIGTEKFLYVMDNDNYGRRFSEKYFKYKGIGFPVPSIFKDVNEVFLKDKGMFLQYLKRIKSLLLQFNN